MDNKYLTIYRDFAERIESGQLRVRTKLPSEHELTQLYGASRETVRKALNLLAENGYIQKVKGRGSFVLGVNRFEFPVSGLVSFKELAARIGKESRTRLVSLETVAPNRELADLLHIRANQPVWEVVRTRTIGGETIILDKDYLRRDLVPKLTKAICEDSIYEYLERTLDQSISFAKKVITVEEPTPEDQDLLEMKGYPMIVVVQNHVYLEDATLFQYTESRHRPDKFRFVDFARRHQ
ncbi:GntR family transcriptional regulator, trehalose operon transcriptional repressor [Melghirimyces thermohalophilus]|uniref:Trehalose operon repressor n=1 Tax=Melghirimyces thermohalophilus TaxID=1236220 RepID=A0A1G6JL45_9BACL|nr:trehalose operon repressor [Melghirimyces thermohalophilus]SDC19460.1 GntR family transcriptional regulator, trehalose operon transcriptional repressor [Melghirimyces thermohalophilus]